MCLVIPISIPDGAVQNVSVLTVISDAALYLEFRSLEEREIQIPGFGLRIGSKDLAIIRWWHRNCINYITNDNRLHSG